MRLEVRSQDRMLTYRLLRYVLGGLLLLSANGCDGTVGDPRMEKLAGVWKLDFAINEELVDNLMDGQQPEDQSLTQKLTRGAAKSFLKEKLPGLNNAIAGVASDSMQLTFATDGTWSSKTAFSMAKGQKKGVWKVIKSSEDSMTIYCQWTDSVSKQSENATVVVSFLTADQIRLVPPNISSTEMELTFDRQPAK